MVAAVVLAAGESRRMGEAKQLIELGGERLLERAVRVAGEAGCSPVVVVLGARAEEIVAACELREARVVVNPDWTEGMGASVRAGVRAVDGAAGVLLMTCDQPGVTPAHLLELARIGQEQGVAVASSYPGDGGVEKRGVPAYFPASCFRKLGALGGDAGARALLADAVAVPLPLGELDVDTPEALARVRAVFGG